MSLARDTSQVIKGPRKVYVVVSNTEYELGFTRGGIQVRLSEVQTYDIDTDQVGTIDTVIESNSARITIPLLQWSMSILDAIMPWSVLSTAVDGKQKLEVGSCRGYSLRQYAVPLILRPEAKTTSDKSEDIKFWLAVPVEPQEITFNSQASNEVINTVWRAFPDTTLALDKNLYVIGDPAVVAA